jgi:hypothetical protein
MSVIDLLRKGFGYVLLSMGVSRPAAKAVPRPRQESKPTPNSDAVPAPKPGNSSDNQSGGDSNSN